MKTKEKPCRKFLRGIHCGDPEGRDHCFNCARHLDPKTGECPKDCGNKGAEHDDRVNDADQDEE